MHAPTDLGAGAPLLDKGTQLAHLRAVLTTTAPYLLQAWPTCNEATVSVRLQSTHRKKKHSNLKDDSEHDPQPEPENVNEGICGGEGRSDENALRSLRRSATNIRRFCLHNGLTHMPTLTYATPAESIDQISEDVRRFRYRILRAPWGPVEPFPYLWVMERGHEGTERLHVHQAVGRWYSEVGCVEVCEKCARPALRAKRPNLPPAGSACWGCLWGHGFVGAPTEGVDDPRALSGYASKYVGKSLGDDLARGRQTYRVAEGFRPQPVRLEVESLAAAGAHLHAMAGDADLTITPLHEKYDDWPGPATWNVRWEDS